MTGAAANARAGKAAAATVAAAMIPAGARLALGTGSTVEAALPALARIPGLLATPTSQIIADRATAAGLTLAPIGPSYDFYLDGVDQLAPGGDAIKGSWGAHVQEKMLAAMSRRRILICDAGKLVDRLVGPVPVAVLPCVQPLFAPAGLLKVDDNGLPVLLVDAGRVIDQPAQWDREVCARPGVVCTGVFPAGFVHEVVIGCPDGSHRVMDLATVRA